MKRRFGDNPAPAVNRLGWALLVISVYGGSFAAVLYVMHCIINLIYH